MRILIAQMTRMGDVIQTSPLIRALRQCDPDAYIAIMVRRMGKAVAAANPDINAIIEYDEDTMFQHLRSQDSEKLLAAYHLADSYVQELRSHRFDVVYNCTHSLSSAILFRLAGIREVIGADLSDDWRYVLRGRGANYFFTSIVHRKYNDLNLCDLFRMFADNPPSSQGLSFAVEANDRHFVHALLADHGIGADEPIACFQLGASDTEKRWPDGNFADLGRQLAATRGLRIVLVGVREEAPLGESFEKHAPGIAVHLFGKTSVPQLAALLQRARLLVTNDTGTMHVAAAVGCPIVLTSVGYVHFRETGPYANGSIAIERRHDDLVNSGAARGADADKQAIRPAHVLQACDLAMAQSDDLPEWQDSPEWSQVGIYTARFAPDGCLQWYPLIKRPINQTDFLRLIYRVMWLHFLHRKANELSEREAIAKVLSRYTIPADSTLRGWCDSFENPVRELKEWASQGARITNDLLDCLKSNQGLARAKAMVGQLVALDDRVRLQGELHEAVKPLTAIFQFERDNLEGADPIPLAQGTLDMYENLRMRAHLTLEKTELVIRSCGYPAAS